MALSKFTVIELVPVLYFYALANASKVRDVLCFRVIYASAFIRDCVPKACEHDILQTGWRNFTKFAALMHLGTKINLLDFEVKGQGRDQTICGKKSLFGVILSPDDDSFHWFGRVVFGSAVWGKMSSEVRFKVMTNWQVGYFLFIYFGWVSACRHHWVQCKLFCDPIDAR